MLDMYIKNKNRYVNVQKAKKKHISNIIPARATSVFSTANIGR